MGPGPDLVEVLLVLGVFLCLCGLVTVMRRTASRLLREEMYKQHAAMEEPSSLHPFLAWLTGPEGVDACCHLSKMEMEYNPIRLLYNKMAGVVVVILEEDYQYALSDTEIARQYDRWEGETLIPWGMAFIFTNSGPASEFAAGTMDDFDSLRVVRGVRMEHCSELFVPFVSQGVVSYSAQRQLLVDSRALWSFFGPEDWWEELIYKHLPVHLRTYDGHIAR